MPHFVQSAIRFSFGRFNTEEEADFYEYLRALDMAKESLASSKDKTLVVSSDSPIARVFAGQWETEEP